MEKRYILFQFYWLKSSLRGIVLEAQPKHLKFRSYNIIYKSHDFIVDPGGCILITTSC